MFFRFTAAACVLVAVGCAPNPPPVALDPSSALAAPERAPPGPIGPLPLERMRDVLIAPGKAVGPIHLGMTRAEVEALRVLAPHPKYPAQTTPYQVIYGDDDRVSSVMISLIGAPTDVRVDRVMLPRGTRFHEARELLGDCTAPNVGFGGGSYTCRGGAIEVLAGSGSPYETWVGTKK